jgi:hypothetical protein
MKNLFNATDRPIKTFMNAQANYSKWNAQPVLYMLILLTAFLFTACKKYVANKPQTDNTEQVTNNNRKPDLELFSQYNGLDPQTLLELQQAKAATAKYQNIENAFADNYGKDPVVTLPNMGYHFLKAELVSPVFDLRKPAILVYNKKDNGKFELVAVEYAVPMSSLPLHVAPEGFTGNDDEWNENTLNTGWWTLHAWVWKNNPDGVFNPMNPLVIVQ